LNEILEHGQFADAGVGTTEAYERKDEPGTWATERIGSDGEVYLAVFYGPDSRDRASEYALFKNCR